MFFKRLFWNVLIVDDEPDVHEVTELALKRERIFGAKLKIHHAESAEEAKELFQETDNGMWMDLTIAIVDVVMETDYSGLDLCRYIREDLGNLSVQLVLRTGQPGQAPPRKIIDDYNISGYLTKVEATRDRLYMTVKNAIQTYYNVSLQIESTWRMEMLRQLKNVSKENVLNQIQQIINKDVSAQGMELHAALDFGDGNYVGAGCYQKQADFEAVKADLFGKAEDQLKKKSGFWPLEQDLVAQVDDHLITQTHSLASDNKVTLVVKEATCPRNMYALYGVMWRQEIAYLAEALAKLA